MTVTVHLTGPQLSQLIHAVTAYMDDPDEFTAGDWRAIANAEKALRQARERLLEKRMRMGLKR